MISSKENPEIKKLRKLLQKKYRLRDGLFLVENEAIIRDASRHGYFFQALFTTTEFEEKDRGAYRDLVQGIPDAKFYQFTENINKHVSSLDTPSGILALYKIQEKKLDQTMPVIYLNAINDPGNLGTIIRTMTAFGFSNLVIDEQCADLYNPKTIQAAKDAIFKINIERDHDFDWLKNKRASLPIYATDVQDGEDLDKFTKDGLFCLVLGSESHGVSEEILAIAQRKINIKISEKIESLNVAVAAGIIMHKLKKQ